MVIESFPSVEYADPESGLLAVGGDLEPESLILAYKSGIFPWPFDERNLTWFSPSKRCILYLDEIKFPSRFLRKIKNNNKYDFSRNLKFEDVISNCATQDERSLPEKTWITKEIIQGYSNLHKQGFAESFECSRGGSLIGGVYGVRINRFFAGESMFHLEPDGSKLALWFLQQQLLSEGIRWIDCQVINPFLASLGAIEIDRDEYLKLLKEVV